MDIVSYRGPGAAGGVSSGLETAWKNTKNADVSWWFLGDDALKFLNPCDETPNFVTQLSENVIKGHYAYCNEFLWPVMHDLPEFCSYDNDKRKLYRKLNITLAQYINFERANKKRYFVQDYQLALLPRLLAAQGGRSSSFWHIPWPKHIRAEFIEPIVEIARGLLAAESVGFHTNEYAQNFMAFVQNYLAEYSVRTSDLVVYKTHAVMQEPDRELVLAGDHAPYVLRPLSQPLQALSNVTKLVVQPLGIDIDKWTEMSRAGSIAYDKVGLAHGERFVLSVDRADYTKAVIERLEIIDKVMARNEDLRGNVAFVQICGRSRAGVAAFDKYWDDCRALGKAVNDRWQAGDWKPIRWVEDSLSSAELAALYPSAEAMLVNPVRDGLNLTAKEFVACRHTTPGVLLLSPGAGAWHELGQHALAADPREQDATVESIVHALHMPAEEKLARTMVMRHKLEKNPLSIWWKQFVQASAVRPAAVAASREAKTA